MGRGGVDTPDRAKPRIVVGVLAAMALATLDQTIVSPALPSIGAQLGKTTYLSWVVTAYLIAATAVTPLYGKIADARGRKPALFGAIAIFIIGSSLCAGAETMTMLIAGRAVQGVGGGGLIALAQTVIADVVAPRERGRYVGYISAVWAGSSVAGPMLGGFLSEHLHWSYIFLINVPLGAVAAVLAARALRSLPEPHRKRPIDPLGSILAVSAATALMLGLTWAGERGGLVTLHVQGAFAVAILFGAAFVMHTRRAPEPMIPLRIIANPVVRTGAQGNFFAYAGYLGVTVFAPFYFMANLGLSPAQAGFAMVAPMLGAVLGANTAGRMMGKRDNYKALGLTGLAVAVVASSVLAARANVASFLEVEALLLLIGVGAGAQNPISTVSVQNAVDPGDLGIATASVAFVRSLGGAFGVASLGAVLIHYGLVSGLRVVGAEGEVAASDPRGFVIAFSVASASFVLSGMCLAAMEQRPLRAVSSYDMRRRAG